MVLHRVSVVGLVLVLAEMVSEAGSGLLLGFCLSHVTVVEVVSEVKRLMLLVVFLLALCISAPAAAAACC